VTAVNDQVRPGVAGDAGDLGQDRVEVLVAGPALATHGPSQVPARDVQQPHRQASAIVRETSTRPVAGLAEHYTSKPWSQLENTGTPGRVLPCRNRWMPWKPGSPSCAAPCA